MKNRLRVSFIISTYIKGFRIFCSPNCALHTLVQALPHSQLSLYKPTLSFNILFLLPIIFYISFPIQNIIPKHVFRHKIQISSRYIVITRLFTHLRRHIFPLCWIYTIEKLCLIPFHEVQTWNNSEKCLTVYWKNYQVKQDRCFIQIRVGNINTQNTNVF